MTKQTKRKTSTRPAGGKARARTVQRKHARRDSYENRTTGHGTSYDRRTHTTFSLNVVTDVEARELWAGEDIAARIIETAPREALRRGFDIKAEDKELSQTIEASVEELGVRQKVMKARQMARAYGGAAIYPAMDSTDDLSKPLDEGSIGKITALHLLEPRELHPVSYYGDISSPKFLTPKSYRLVPITSGVVANANAGQVIHESRLVIFQGLKVTRQIQHGQRPGWGHSILNRPQQVIADYGIAWGGAAHLLTDFAKGVLKLDGFADLSAANQESLIAARLSAIEQAASTLKMLVIDREDEYSRQQTPLSGLADLLIQFAQRVAAAADMPVTILMGMSPSGLNATGDMDIRSWYDRVAAEQEEMRPMIEQLVRLLLISADGPTQGVEPEQWSIEFHPLWAPSSMEKAQERKLVADTDAIYLEHEVVSPSDVAESRWKGDTYSAEMVVDWTARDKMLAANAVKAEALDAASLDALNPDAAGATRVVANAPSTRDASPAPIKTTAAPASAPTIVKPAPTVAPAANEALNGAQVTSLVAVVTAVLARQISREAGAAIIQLAYNVSASVAQDLLGPEGFVPANANEPSAEPAQQAA